MLNQWREIKGLTRNILCETYIQHPYRVVVHLGSWRAEQHDTSIRRTLNHVISHDAIHTGHADAIGPFLKSVRATWTNIVVLNKRAVTVETPLSKMEAGPAPRIIRMHKLDEMVKVRFASHFNVGSTVDRRCTSSCPVNLYIQIRDKNFK